MSSSSRTKIGFIGGGNMATSLIGGLLDSDNDPGTDAGASASDILVIEPDTAQRATLEDRFGIETSADISEIERCDTVVLAVKPQVMQSVCRSIEAYSDTLYISIAAGIPTHALSRWLGNDPAKQQQLAIVRCMPNTPSLLKCGASGLYANDYTDEQQRQTAQHIMEAAGIVVWVDEEDKIDAVTAVSGSGPAYYFLMMEAMQQAGERLGLDAETAQQLVLQTALGAARMAIESGDEPATLRKKVMSKGGTTECAINSFQADGFEAMVERALSAARDRGRTLAEELSDE